MYAVIYEYRTRTMLDIDHPGRDAGRLNFPSFAFCVRLLPPLFTYMLVLHSRYHRAGRMGGKGDLELHGCW